MSTEYQLEPNRNDICVLPSGDRKHFTGAERDELDELANAFLVEAQNVASIKVPFAEVSDGARRKLRESAIRLKHFMDRSKVSTTASASSGRKSGGKGSSTSEE